jgi:hypothetical protein
MSDISICIGTEEIIITTVYNNSNKENPRQLFAGGFPEMKLIVLMKKKKENLVY